MGKVSSLVQKFGSLFGERDVDDDKDLDEERGFMNQSMTVAVVTRRPWVAETLSNLDTIEMTRAEIEKLENTGDRKESVYIKSEHIIPILEMAKHYPKIRISVIVGGPLILSCRDFKVYIAPQLPESSLEPVNH